MELCVPWYNAPFACQLEKCATEKAILSGRVSNQAAIYTPAIFHLCTVRYINGILCCTRISIL